MNGLKHYLVYLITNTVNGKIYVGKHETFDPDDDYMGSGNLLKRAQAKYGLDKFTKTILADFDEPWSMANMEAVIVDEEFIKRKDTYNITVGGIGGFWYINQMVLTSDKRSQRKLEFDKRLANQLGCSVHEFYSKKCKQVWKDLPEEKRNMRVQNQLRSLRNFYKTHNGSFCGKKHSEESLIKMRATFARIGHQQGEKHSQYGKHWWHDPVTGESHPFHDNEVPQGWIRGRKVH